MEKISIHNYEAFILDYYENNLSAEQVAELLLFLEEHPELKPEFEEFELITLPGSEEELTFPDKEKLKKGSAFNPYSDESMIASMEGWLNEGEQTVFNKALNEDGNLQKEYLFYLQTKLPPDTTIVFAEKNKLKKKNKGIVRLPVYAILAVAASLVLLFGIRLLLTGPANNEHGGNPVANYPASPTRKNTGEAPLKNTSDMAIRTDNKAEIVPSKSSPSEQTKEMALRTSPGINHPTSSTTARDSLFMINPAPLALPDAGQETQIFAMLDIPNQELMDDNGKDEHLRSHYQNVPDYVASQVLGEEINSEKGSHLGWRLTKLMVRGFNKVTGSHIRIREEYDKQGELVSYALNAGAIGYERNARP